MFSRLPTPITIPLRAYVRSFTTATPLKPPTVTAPHYPRPLKMALLGAPGVGKGTFASRIGPYFGLPGISTGDLIRAEIKTGSPRGQSLKLITDRGGLIDDSIVLEMLMQRLSQPDCIHGFILDGYPRRISQAQALQAVCRLDLVLNIGLREDILITKATARRVCGVCGAGYNFANIENGPYRMPPLLPKIKDTCDKCGSHPLPLLQRSDDTESTVRERLIIYHRETAPLIDYYEKQGLLINWEVKQGLGDWNAMRDMLRAVVDQKMDQSETSTPTSSTATATVKVSCPR